MLNLSCWLRGEALCANGSHYWSHYVSSPLCGPQQSRCRIRKRVLSTILAKIIRNQSTAMASKSKGASRLTQILSFLVSISTIIGIPVGLYGYFSSQHKDRVGATFQFYKEFRSEQTQKDWSLLINRWNAKAQDARTIVRSGNDKELSDFVETLVSDSDGSAAMERVLSLFDEMSACVDNSLCDRNAAYALLKVPADEFAAAFGPHIFLIRKEFGNDQYGVGLLRLRAIKKTTLSLF